MRIEDGHKTARDKKHTTNHTKKNGSERRGNEGLGRKAGRAVRGDAAAARWKWNQDWLLEGADVVTDRSHSLQYNTIQYNPSMNMID